MIIQPKEAGHFLLLSAQIKQQDPSRFHLTLHNGLRYETTFKKVNSTLHASPNMVEHALDLEEPQGLKSKTTFS